MAEGLLIISNLFHYRLSFQYQTAVNGELQSFYFDAYPNIVFNTAFMAIDVLTQNIECKTPRTLSFDAANSLNTVTWASVGFLQNEGCVATLNPFLFGYSTQFPESSFTIAVDMDTFVTAVAINSGIRTWSNLGDAEPNTFSVEYNGGNYTLSFKVMGLSCVFLGIL